MDEFLTPAERQNRALQFEKLRQLLRVSVADYAREFKTLGKYAPYIIHTKAARVERFRSRLVISLYIAMVTA